MRWLSLIFVFCCSFAFCGLLSAQSNEGFLKLRFMDSQTGYAVQPQVVISGFENRQILPVPVDRSGRAGPRLPYGDYTLTITSETHQPMTAAIAVNSATPPFQFSLDPLAKPVEIQPENIIPWLRSDATIFLGYVMDDQTGRPLKNVKVQTLPSGSESLTDKRGYFRLAVPLQSDSDWKNAPASLIFSRKGYISEERQNLELSPYGDGIVRVRLQRGSGSNVINEEGRRINADPRPFGNAPVIQSKEPPVSYATSPTNATARLPRNIRVQLENGTIDYVSMETYVQRSLNDEWIASWGNLASGSGMNSLKSGAVAVRSYAASFVNSPRGTTYDICATTSCQVYDTDTSSNTDTAASETAGFVLLTSTGSIARSEYSAENNSIGSTVTGIPCGDGYTEPSTNGPVCLFDPACAGEVRFGHGRGMCQWGTARWASGFKMAGRSSSDTSPNGYPKKDWVWLVNHYYPTLTLVQAKPLIVGDDIKLIGSSSRTNYMCSDGGISSGINCTDVIFTKAVGSTGVITSGPQRVTSDGMGFTWWKISWSDGAVGWLPDNYLERVVPLPGALSGLSATVASSTQINLSWSDTNNFEAGFRIERAPASGGPWQQISEVGANSTSFNDANLTAGNPYFYRVRAYNVTGNSAYSATASASTPGVPPTLAAIANRTIVEGTTLIFTNTASAPDRIQRLTDFENFAIETVIGAVLFRRPGFSTSTSTNINIVPDYASVTDLFPAGTGLGNRALLISCHFTNTTTPWLRLTTSSAPFIPNPVIDLTNKFQFRIYSDNAIRVGLGVRETTTAYGTPIGSNGGTSGAIEWVGVTNKNGNAPVPSRLISAGTWTTLTFDFANEPVLNFSGGNNVLSTASGLGVLEHLAIVPAAGTNIYRVFMDNFTVIQPKKFTFSLGTGAPTGASVNATNGVFTWTPTEAQGPGEYAIQMIVADNGNTVLKATNTFTVTVTETNAAPVLAAIANRTVHAGNNVVFTNSATDSDIPANVLTFSLDSGAPFGAAIHSSSGVFSWMPGDSFIGTTNSITVRVTDNGSPALSDAKSFNISVLAKPAFETATLSGGNIYLNWSAISGRSYKVQFKDNLNEINWSDLATVVATGNSAAHSAPAGTGQRYYRIIALD